MTRIHNVLLRQIFLLNFDTAPLLSFHFVSIPDLSSLLLFSLLLLLLLLLLLDLFAVLSLFFLLRVHVLTVRREIERDEGGDGAKKKKKKKKKKKRIRKKKKKRNTKKITNANTQPAPRTARTSRFLQLQHPSGSMISLGPQSRRPLLCSFFLLLF